VHRVAAHVAAEVQLRAVELGREEAGALAKVGDAVLGGPERGDRWGRPELSARNVGGGAIERGEAATLDFCRGQDAAGKAAAQRACMVRHGPAACIGCGPSRRVRQPHPTAGPATHLLRMSPADPRSS
jgi:hypothetical protein